MKKRAYSGLSSFLLSRLELKSFAKIGEAYLRGFSARVVSDRIDDFLKAMSSADLWMFRMALVAGALLPTAFFRWVAGCENDNTGVFRYRLSARLHFPLKTMVVMLYYGDAAQREIEKSRRGS